MGVLGDPELQTVEVPTEETQQLMCQKVVIEQLGRETAKNQLPNNIAIHRSNLTWRGFEYSLRFNQPPSMNRTAKHQCMSSCVISTVVEVELGYRQQDPGERQV